MRAQEVRDTGLIEIPLYVDLTAVVVGALSGAVFAARKHFDVAGVLLIAAATGLGGGVIRDVLLNVRPIALVDSAYLVTVLTAAVVGFFFAGLVRRFTSPLMWIDAAALGLFTVVGVEKALVGSVPVIPAVAVGVIAATGGSILRDMLSGDQPEVVRSGPWNAVAAIVGGIVYVMIARGLGMDRVVAEVATIGTVLLTRLLSVYRGWETPVAHDFTYVMSRPIDRLRRRRLDDVNITSDEQRGGAS
ncbi:MAG: TRIC cation channel family protein [Candidatus Nanopelagicales bacterium]